MKMSDVFDLPVKSSSSNPFIRDSSGGSPIYSQSVFNDLGDNERIARAQSISVAINNHDKLVDALLAITSDYVQLAESGDAGCWSADDVEVIVNSRRLLKELGHEI